ncbi:hypothetical protein K440DRAFT_640114 [Wilcoxina mikolae CBS 423.85]|nr:hypothetical protein K440DRAFT_640114 [Wilcoxina mikolae CBS 423.85]
MKVGRAGVDNSSPATKPKQSKSRNGCVTCKAKRLKCDETKPTCQQCQKRSVACGGYKKDFKWRPFEESTIAGKGLKPSKKGVGIQKPKKATSPPRPSPRIANDRYDIPLSRISFGQSFPMQYTSMSDDIFPLEPIYIGSIDQPPIPPQTAALQINDNTIGAVDEGLYGNGNPNLLRIENSPRLADITALKMENTRNGSVDTFQELLDFATKQPELYDPREMMQEHTTTSITDAEVEEDEIEEMIRTSPPSQSNWISSPTPSILSSSSSDSHSSAEQLISVHDIFRRPTVAANSPEVLLSFFDKNTCGIMSVKDGPTENPWRTLIWPLARDSQALYHAISSMTAFHMCRDRPQLRVEGMEHMRKSIRFLAQGLSHGNIREDAALGTTLVLAFSEAFDTHISTGIEHLRGARVLLNQALAKISPQSVPTEGFRRLQFLYNVWVYLDVLARLTSDSDESNSDNPIMSYTPLLRLNEIDPLLGCAATLFPLIGQAARLVQRVRNSDRNSVGIISAAMDLKMLLESWEVEENYAPIEDPSSDVIHCMKTAEAYRWATLLYLHQAVPELPPTPAHDLAEKVMRLIASIPQSSRCCIVHIYPLLAAGCEAVGYEERSWVKNRWEGMMSRMWIGNVEKAWQVVKEVWDRRDSFLSRQTPSPAMASLSTPNSSYGSPPQEFESQHKGKHFDSNDIDSILSWDSSVFETGLNSPGSRALPDSIAGRLQLELLQGKRSNASDVLQEHRKGDFEYEVSIKGKLHWLGVMKDWRWEVLLG